MDPVHRNITNTSDEKAASIEKVDALQYGTYDAEANSDIVRSPDGRVMIDAGFDAQEIKKTMRKVDWRLVPILAALYSISLIDRTNLALARAAGMEQVLTLRLGDRYSITVVTFFATYIVFEYPSTFGLRKFGAAKWLGTATVLWGAIMLGMVSCCVHPCI